MNIKKNRTIGIRTDDHFMRLLESASKMYNASKSEIIRSAVARTMECPLYTMKPSRFLIVRKSKFHLL